MGRGGEEGEIEIEHGIIFPSSLKLQGPCLSFPLRRLICPPGAPPPPTFPFLAPVALIY